VGGGGDACVRGKEKNAGVCGRPVGAASVWEARAADDKQPGRECRIAGQHVSSRTWSSFMTASTASGRLLPRCVAALAHKRNSSRATHTHTHTHTHTNEGGRARALREGHTNTTCATHTHTHTSPGNIGGGEHPRGTPPSAACEHARTPPRYGPTTQHCLLGGAGALVGPPARPLTPTAARQRCCRR
jgi:hypothetical protein